MMILKMAHYLYWGTSDQPYTVTIEQTLYLEDFPWRSDAEEYPFEACTKSGCLYEEYTYSHRSIEGR